MISETQMRYGSRISRHAIGRAAVRNHRRSAPEIHEAKRGSSLVSRLISPEPVLPPLASSYRGTRCAKLEEGWGRSYRAVGNPASFHFVIPPGNTITFGNPNSRITLTAPFVRFPVRQYTRYVLLRSSFA